MLEEYKEVPYCMKCKAMLIMWNEEVTELYAYQRFFAPDGIQETGDSEFLDTVKVNQVICRECSSTATHHVLIKTEVFLQILKYAYRDENCPDDLFKIDLKKSKTKDCMIAPTLQEIKEAITVELI